MSAKPASEQLRIRLHGFPIAYSASPLFQNTCFETDSYAWRYELYSTSKLTRDVLDFLRSEDSAGAAFTMPLKAEIMPFLDDITPESRLTGAVNTVVKVQHDGGVRLAGTNTDFLGILSTLRKAVGSQQVVSSTGDNAEPFTSFQSGQYSAIVVGGGATTRSAILALWTLGIRHICLINRDEEEVKRTISWFQQVGLQDEGLKLRHMAGAEDVEKLYENSGEDWPILALGVGAIPSILPTTAEERLAYSTAAHILTQSSSSILARHTARHTASSSSLRDDTETLSTIQRPIFLDMAYHPRETHLLKLADALGWQTISGENAMIEQGYAQQRMWRLGDPSAEAGMGVKGVVLSVEAMRAAEHAIRTMGDIHLEGAEVDWALVVNGDA